MEGGKDNKLLSMHRLSPTPFSSDEGAESGDDSEEDIVTNYLPGSAGAPLVGREGPTTSSHHHHHHHHHQLLLFNQQQQPQQHQQQTQQKPKPQLTMQHQQQHHHHQQQQQPMVASVLPIHTHAQGPPRRLVRMAEIPTMDSITAESLGMGVSVGPADAFIPPIPTISITPHSPIAHKPFTVLDENIRQLQGIQATIQRMRETNLAVKSGRGLSRLSTSCPSLNVDGEEIDDEDSPTCKSPTGGGPVLPGPSTAGSSGHHHALAHHQARRGSGRLSSRSDDGETTSPNTPNTPNTPITSSSLDEHHLCPDTPKIRVNDSTPTGSEEFLDARKSRVGSTSDCHRRRSWSGLSDEEKKRANRHRSISLSSLDSDAEEAFYDAEDSTNTQGSDSVDGGCRRAVEKQRSMSGSSSPVTYGGGGSSTHSLNDVHLQEKRSSGPIEKPRLLAPRLTLQKSVSTPSILAGVTAQPAQQPPQSNYQLEDTKRRKRGSLFFRKKKDKLKKTSHHFVAVCYSNSATCDVCSKPMTNKPALRCENCQVCVHENSCKDQISDCSKLKNPKVIQKPGTTTTLGTTTKSSSLGSYAGSGTGAPLGTSTKTQPPVVARSRSSAAHSSPTRPTSVSSPSPRLIDHMLCLPTHCSLDFIMMSIFGLLLFCILREHPTTGLGLLRPMPGEFGRLANSRTASCFDPSI